MATDTEEIYMTVTDEVWESNRWFITSAWSKPIAEPLFGDFSKKIEYKDFPKSPDVPEGWAWVSEWMVDKSQSFGSVDEDGWAYGTTFEALQEAIETNSTSSTSAGMQALVRRRKWVRTRVCNSKQLFKELHSKIEILSTTRSSIEMSMRQQQKNLSIVKKFELLRVKAYETAFCEFVEDMDVVGAVMREYMIKLSKMKAFLLERAVVERDYSQKLKQLSMKWLNAGDAAPSAKNSRVSSVDSGHTGRESTVSTSSDAHTFVDDIVSAESTTQDRRPGFFYLINSSSIEVAENLESFSDLLSDSLCKDVDETLYDVSRIANSYLNDSPKLKKELLAKEESVVRAIRALHSNIDIFLAKSSNNIILVMNEIMSLKTTGKQTDQSITQKDKIGNTFDAAGYSDIFLAYQKYRKAVSAVTLHLSTVDHFCKSKFPVAQQCSMKVGVLLQSVAKIFANEQMRVWSGACDLSRRLKDIKRGKIDSSCQTTKHNGAKIVLDDHYEANFAERASLMDASPPQDVEDDEEDVISAVSNRFSLPDCSGIVKHGMIRYCESLDKLKASAGATGVVAINGSSVDFIDVYAILFVDGMLHLYEKIPPSNNSVARKVLEARDIVVDGATDSRIKPSNSPDYWSAWIGDTPIRSLCTANSSGAITLVSDPSTNSGDRAVYMSQFSPSCEVSMLLSSDAEQDVFKVTCYTTTKGASISAASASVLSRSAAELSGDYSTAESVFTSCEGAPAGDAREWVRAIIQPYNRNRFKDPEDVLL